MKSKKFVALTAMLLMSATTVGAFAGCSGKEIIDPTYDSSKAALQVGTYEGGVGRAWLDDAARRFEELHKNSTFGGKTGVQVFVDAHKVNYGGEAERYQKAYRQKRDALSIHEGYYEE